MKKSYKVVPVFIYILLEYGLIFSSPERMVQVNINLPRNLYSRPSSVFNHKMYN